MFYLFVRDQISCHSKQDKHAHSQFLVWAQLALKYYNGLIRQTKQIKDKSYDVIPKIQGNLENPKLCPGKVSFNHSQNSDTCSQDVNFKPTDNMHISKHE